jgi:hypothetical protein
MNLQSKIRSRFRALFGQRKLDTEMHEEMRSHIEMRAQANIRAGMKLEEARLAALRQFGWTKTIWLPALLAAKVDPMETLRHE